MPTATEDVQLNVGNVLEHHLGTFEGDGAVVAPPQQQCGRRDGVQIPPQRIHSVPLGEGSVVVVIELDMAFVERCLVSPAHHILAELLVIKDHCTNKGSHLPLGRPLPVEVPEHFFLSLGGVGPKGSHPPPGAINTSLVTRSGRS